MHTSMVLLHLELSPTAIARHNRKRQRKLRSMHEKCQEAEERIGKARKGSDTQELLYAKQDRLDHLMEERADKLSYYAARVAARQPATDMVSAIIDKMDGAKNMCPRCVLTVEPICMQHTSSMYNITPHLWITVSCATPRRPTRS